MLFKQTEQPLDFKKREVKRAFAAGFALGVSLAMLGSALMSITT